MSQIIRDIFFLLGVALLAAGIGAWDWRVAAAVVGALFVCLAVVGTVKGFGP